jgi:hypothetical protein
MTTLKGRQDMGEKPTEEEIKRVQQFDLALATCMKEAYRLQGLPDPAKGQSTGMTVLQAANLILSEPEEFLARCDSIPILDPNVPRVILAGLLEGQRIAAAKQEKRR